MITEKQRADLKANNITFACFKMVVSALMTKNDITEDQWVSYYEDYAESVDKYSMTIEEFTEDYFQDWEIPKTGCELRSRTNTWVSANIKPEYNVSVMVFIPDEDNHITAGMWDISNKWVLLDEYREPTCEVTHWMKMPNEPTL